jgi:VWFA-related protein
MRPASAIGLLCGLTLLDVHSVLTSQLPTFRAGIRVIEFDVVVNDGDGNSVPNLSSDDFEVLEDGTPREIVEVSELNLPVDRNGRPLQSPITSSAPVDVPQIGEVGRVYVMLLSSGDPERVRGLGRQFVEEFLGPTDLMAVLHGNRAMTQGLTSRKELLLTAIDRFTGGSGGNAFETLKEVAVNLNALSGRRKAILFIGTAPGMFSMQAERLYNDAIRTAVRNNVRIYPIDPRGMISRALEQIAVGAPSPAFGDPGGMAARIMAADTGGIAIANTNNFGGNFRRIVRDNSAYYTIAFSSSAERDGDFHRVTVRVKDRPELRVRARSGYRATTPDVKGRSVKLPNGLSGNAREALQTSAPTTGLPLEVFTAVFQAEKYEGSVLIGAHLPGDALTLATRDRIELSYIAIDRWGTVRAAERRAFTLTFTDAMRDRVRATGVRLFGRLQLPRGTYEIRVAAHQPNGGTGSAAAAVEVPDYTELPLSISDFVVASTHGRTLTTLEEDPVLRRALPAQPTVNRQFTRGETLTVFGEIYDSHWILSREIGVTQVLRSEDGRVISHQERALRTGNRGRFYYTGEVPLASLPPGTYRLSIEAYTRDGVPASASQQLEFQVREVSAAEGAS